MIVVSGVPRSRAGHSVAAARLRRVRGGLVRHAPGGVPAAPAGPRPQAPAAQVLRPHARQDVSAPRARLLPRPVYHDNTKYNLI